MSVFYRLPIIRTLFATQAAAAEVSRRWSRIGAANPLLVEDLIVLSGLLPCEPDDFVDGVPMGAPIDPCRLAYERGRRDMARQMLALMCITPSELRTLMED